MVSRRLRPPINLFQTDMEDCVVCTLAQTLYVWRIIDRPNVRQLSRQLKRRPGQRLDDSDARLSLLRRGFEVVEYGTWDPDKFLAQGESYLKRYFRSRPDGKRLAQDMKQQVTIAEYLRLAQRDQVRFRPYERKGSYRRVLRVPTGSDIKRLLRQGWTLDVCLYDPRAAPDSYHAGLLVPRSHFGAWQYWPQLPDEEGLPVRQVKFSEATRTTRLYHGIAAIRLPD